MKKLRIAVSACILGQPTRWDGAAKPEDLTILGKNVEFIPFCPEMAAGLGCPRKPIELEAPTAAGDTAHVVDVATRRDITAQMRAACEAQAARLAALPEGAPDLFLLKSRSPSCGVDTPLHDHAGNVIGRAPGEWARVVRTTFKGVPVLTEDDLATMAPSELEALLSRNP